MKLKLLLLSCLVIILAAAACSGESPVAIVVEDEPILQDAEIILQVSITIPLDQGLSIAVELLDEVTGLAFNPTRYPLERIDDLNYFVRIHAPIGSILKYRYIKLNEIPSPEYSSENRPVRFRFFHVTGPAVQKDFVASWIDSPFAGDSGSLLGTITAASGTGIPQIIVSIAGLTTVTNEEGKYQINNIPEGTHTLTALSKNGDFMPFQQGAVISANAVTPANFQIIPAQKVRLTFIVDVPDGEYSNVPVRMAGNLEMLGNSGLDLNAGLSTLASNCPSLVQLETGQYAITVEVGIGTYIEYKYTLGDGFWNAELNENGNYVLRKLIVPDSDATYNDTVKTWSSLTNAPITFSVTVPVDTDIAKLVGIRFNPFTWTNPIPMWSMGNNRWTYTLYNPLDILTQVSYQYCLESDCQTGSGESIAVLENASSFFVPSPTSQSFQDVITSWR